MNAVTFYSHKVQMQAVDIAALASSGCDASTLALAISDLRDAVSELATEARDCRKHMAS